MTATFDEFFQQRQAQGGTGGVIGAPGGTARATQAEPTVYLGNTGKYIGSTFVNTANNVPISQAELAFYSWDDAEKAQWGKRLYGAGVIKDPADHEAAFKAWEYAVAETAKYNASGRATLTPWSFMDMLEQQGAFKPNLDARATESAAARPRTTTSTSTQYQIPSKSDAQAAIRTLFREQLGRDPDQGEEDRYTSMMLSKFRANPASTTTTTTQRPDGSSSSTSTQKSGFNPSGVLEDEVKGDPEWGAYQAATQYYNALQGALSAPGDF